MLDDSFCCLKVIFFVQNIRIEFQKVPWMPASLSGYVVWWLHMHPTVYACGCYL